jgi:hypothetical protein
MLTAPIAIRCLRAGLPLAAAVAMLAGCQARPIASLAVSSGQPTLGALVPAETLGAAVMSGPMGTAEMRIVLSGDKAQLALGTDRRVQSVDLAKATAIDVYVTGAGINGWATVKSNAAFGAADAVTGLRTASFTGSVQAGLRRVFRVVVKAGSTTLEEVWGVADIPAATTTTVKIDRFTTPVGEVFRKLLLAGDTAKALALPVADVQALTDRLLNTNSATGAPLDPAQPQINHTLLNTDLAASAVALGEGGTAYKVPAVLPSFLVPTPVKKGAVTLRAMDVLGRPITTEGVGYLNDQASPIKRTNAGDPLVITFPDVTPGAWTATLVDTASGRLVTKAASVADGQAKDISMLLPPRAIERTIGAYNLETNAVNGYNGDFMPPSLASLNNPQNLHANNQVITWADVANQRVRQVDLASNAPIVRTLAGNGITATAAAADGSNATEVPISLDDSCSFTHDAAGNLLFSEGGFSRVLRIDKTTGQLSTVLTASQLAAAGFPAYGIGNIQYVAATDTLYVTNAYNWRNFSSNAIMAVKLGTFPAAGSVTRLINGTKGGFCVAGGYMFYSVGSLDSVILRRDLTAGTTVNITGKTKLYENIDGVPAQEFYINERSLNRIAHTDFAIDPLGNLFVTADSQELYRITDVLNGADGANNWFVHLLHAYNSAAVSAGVAVDATTGEVYMSGTATVADPNSAGTKSVHAINLLRP